MLRSALQRGGRLREPAVLALATACATAAGMLATKAAWILVVARTDLGRDQLTAELGPSSVLAWIGVDLAVATLWGAVAGAAFGFARRPLARTLARAGLIAAQLALATALFLAAEVYAQFGSAPTWQLLDAVSDADNFGDSLAALAGPLPIALGLALAAVLVGGPLYLRRVLDTRPVAIRRLSLALCAVLGVGVLGVATAEASRFELDRNPLALFATSAFDDEVAAPAAPPGAFADILAPIAEPPPLRADTTAYLELRGWARGRPNVVVVVLETTAVSHFELFGGPVANTPNLSRMAERGVLWTRYYAHTPNSMVALYEILGANHGRPAASHISVTRPRIAVRSLSEVLSSHGYRAGLFHSGRFSFWDKDKFFARRGYEVLRDAIAMPRRERFQTNSWGIEERATVEAIHAWVDEDRSRPFFVTYIPVYPHHPYDVPHPRYRKFRGKGRVGRYRDAVYYIDQMMGELVAGFGDRGLIDDTLFVFVGDHGEGFDEHPGSRMHGSKLYDEATHVLALWYAPGALDRGYIDDRPFGHVDLVPTLLDIMGLPQPQEHPGVSATAPGPRPMVPLYTGYGQPLVGFVDGRYKAIVNRRTTRVELYDLATDPKERNSLADERVELATRYAERAEQFVAAQAAWEDALGDLPPPEELPPGRDEVWTVDPATCEFDARHMEVVDGRLAKGRGGHTTVRCEHPLPGKAGAITGMVVRGNENVNAAAIEAMVSWVLTESTRRHVAYCRLNGSNKRPEHASAAELVPGQTRFDGGGKLVLELLYKSPKAVPFDRFGVAEVEVSYRLFE